MKVSWARSSASAWLPAVSRAQRRAHRRLVAAHELRERVAVIANDDARNELGIGKRRLRHRMAMIARAGRQVRCRDHQAGGGFAGVEARASPGRGDARSRRRELPLLEPPEHDEADADEQQHEAEPFGEPVVEQRIERQRETRRRRSSTPLRRSDHAARRAHLLRLLVDRPRRRACGGLLACRPAPPARRRTVTMPFSASFSIVSFSIRALRIRYQRMSAIASTGDEERRPRRSRPPSPRAPARRARTRRTNRTRGRSPKPSIVDARSSCRAFATPVPASRWRLPTSRWHRATPRFGLSRRSTGFRLAIVDLDRRAPSLPVDDRDVDWRAPAFGAVAAGSWAPGRATGGDCGTRATARPRKKAVAEHQPPDKAGGGTGGDVRWMVHAGSLRRIRMPGRMRPSPGVRIHPFAAAEPLGCVLLFPKRRGRSRNSAARVRFVQFSPRGSRLSAVTIGSTWRPFDHETA